MILNLFLVFPDLLLHFVQALVKCGPGLASFRTSNKIVLVFRIHQDFDLHVLVIEVERYLNGRNPFEIGEQFFRF